MEEPNYKGFEVYENIINEKTLKYNFVFVEDYYILKWDNLSKENRAALRSYPSWTFGSSLYNLAAPTYLQPVLFGKIFLEEFNYEKPGFDRAKLLAYLIEKFPNSEYIPLIQKKMEEQKK